MKPGFALEVKFKVTPKLQKAFLPPFTPKRRWKEEEKKKDGRDSYSLGLPHGLLAQGSRRP